MEAPVSRRYLTLSEVESALNRGRPIECFLGSCERGTQPGIKWFSISCNGEKLCLKIHETADLGNEDFLDLYGFGPLNPELELDEPDEEIIFDDFKSAIAEIEMMFPSSSAKLVNEGVIQDEYSEFISRGRK